MIVSGRNYIYLFSYFLIVISFLTVLSCGAGNDKSDNTESDVIFGKWIMHKASRDGKLTETLKDSYFNFESPNILVNNINRREQAFSFEILDGKILQRGSLDLDYDILKFNSDTLILGTQIRDYDFQFFLLRDTASMKVDSLSIEL